MRSHAALALLLLVFAFSQKPCARADVLYGEVKTCPVGWTSVEQITDARQRLTIDPLSSRVFDGTVEFLAPMDGTLQETGGYYILESNLFRVAYPMRPGATFHETGQTQKGDLVVRYSKAEKAPFLFMLANATPTLGYPAFSDTYYTFVSEKSVPVFALSTGYPFARPSSVPDLSTSILSIIDGHYEVRYEGIEGIATSDGVEAGEGSLIGWSELALDKHIVSVRIMDPTIGEELSPSVIYVEVLQ